MGKRKFTGKRAKDAKQDSRLKALEVFVKKTVENKQINFTNSVNATATVLELDLAMLLSQGTGDGGDINLAGAAEARIGNNVTLMEQHFKFCVREPASPDAYNQVRVMIVESADGAQPLTFKDVVNFANPVVYSAPQLINSGYTTKTTTNRRYRVLMDKRIHLSSIGKPSVSWSFRKKYKHGKVIEYNDNLSAIPTSWSQRLFILSDSTLTMHPIVDYYYRNTYKDA